MKLNRIATIAVAAMLAMPAFAQAPEQNAAPQGPRPTMPKQEVKPGSPQNTLHAPILPFRKTTVEKVAYNGYEESNQYVKDADVVFIGDSITENWYTYHHDFFDNNNFIARGIGGQTTISILCRFRQDAVKLNPKVVVILCGINDVAQNDGVMDYEDLTDNIIAMCDQAKANNIKVLLCSLTPCDRFSWNKEAVPAPDVVKLNEVFKAYAASAGIQYVDYYSALENGQGGMKEVFTKDGCHPTNEGYNVMERIIVKEINKALNTNKDYFVTPE